MTRTLIISIKLFCSPEVKGFITFPQQFIINTINPLDSCLRVRPRPLESKVCLEGHTKPVPTEIKEDF